MRLINARPSRPLQVALATLPFVIVIIAYMMGSAARLADNPSDKLLSTAIGMS